MSTLEQLITNAAGYATAHLHAHGHLTPVWIGERENGMVVPIVPAIDAMPADPALLFEAVRDAIQLTGIVRCVQIAEAFELAGQAAQAAARNPALQRADNPDARRIVVIRAEDKSGQVLMGRCYILSPEHGKPTLSPVRMYAPADNVTGPWAPLFAPAPESGTRH